MSTHDRELLDNLEEFVRVYLADPTTDGTPPAAAYVNGATNHIPIDWADLYQYDHQLADDYLTNPEAVREYLQEALANITIGGNELAARHDGPIPIEVRNLPDDRHNEIGQFDTDAVGELVTINGQITHKSIVYPKLDEATFICRRCGTDTTVPQTGRDVEEPHECAGCERQGPFQLDADASQFTPQQVARVQVPPERAGSSTGDSVDVILDGEHLTNRLAVGDRATIGSQLQVDIDDNQPSWRPVGTAIEREQTDMTDLEVTDDDKQRIREIASAPDTFDRLVDSIAPSIWGHRDIKLAILLQLFGGVKKELRDGSTKRGDSHVLIVGDPGTGKTDLIQYASTLVPRSVFTSGKSATGVGLTAAATRDDFADGEWTIKGGAMVRANKGLCAVDEFDKMSDSDRNSLFEAMQSQQISVSKAGINATLPAETKMLAAANPIMGRFDPYQPIAEQFDLDPALISRFDLIFTVSDKPDPDADRRLAEHLNDTARAAARRQGDGGLDDDADPSAPPVAQELVQKYVSFASEYTPELSDGAAERIRDEYVAMRGANDYDENAPVPTTPRAINAMHRLAEASARIRLSKTVTEGDVERAVGLWKSCLQDIGVDPETGEYDADMVETGTSKSQRDRLKNLKAIVADLEDETDRGAPLDEVKAVAGEAGIDEGKVEHEIEKLKQQGEMYEVADDYLRTT